MTKEEIKTVIEDLETIKLSNIRENETCWFYECEILNVNNVQIFVNFENPFNGIWNNEIDIYSDGIDNNDAFQLEFSKDFLEKLQKTILENFPSRFYEFKEFEEDDFDYWKFYLKDEEIACGDINDSIKIDCNKIVYDMLWNCYVSSWVQEKEEDLAKRIFG